MVKGFVASHEQADIHENDSGIHIDTGEEQQDISKSFNIADDFTDYDTGITYLVSGSLDSYNSVELQFSEINVSGDYSNFEINVTLSIGHEIISTVTGVVMRSWLEEDTDTVLEDSEDGVTETDFEYTEEFNFESSESLEYMLEEPYVLNVGLLDCNIEVNIESAENVDCNIDDISLDIDADGKIEILGRQP